VTAERQIRRAAHAFPPRWRQHSGDELVATALASLAPDVRRAPRRLLVDIVLAGWRERLRDRPPFYRWVPYLMGVPIHPKWQVWARDDIGGALYPQRVALRVTCVVAPPYVVVALALGAHWVWLFPLMQLVGWMLTAPLYAKQTRTRAYRRNGISFPGQDPPWPPVPTFEPHPPLDRGR